MADRAPSADARLCDAKQALATLSLITRAVSQADDLALPEEIQNWAWSGVADIADRGYAAVEAAYDALPDLSVPAPLRDER